MLRCTEDLSDVDPETSSLTLNLECQRVPELALLLEHGGCCAVDFVVSGLKMSRRSKVDIGCYLRMTSDLGAGYTLDCSCLLLSNSGTP